MDKRKFGRPARAGLQLSLLILRFPLPLPTAEFLSTAGGLRYVRLFRNRLSPFAQVRTRKAAAGGEYLAFGWANRSLGRSDR